MTTAAAMEMATACGSEDMWRRQQSTAAAVNGIDSRWEWQPMEVAVDGGSGRRWWRSTGKDERGGWKVIWLVVWGRGEQRST